MRKLEKEKTPYYKHLDFFMIRDPILSLRTTVTIVDFTDKTNLK